MKRGSDHIDRGKDLSGMFSRKDYLPYIGLDTRLDVDFSWDFHVHIVICLMERVYENPAY